jgi:hypothetical protein
MRPILFSVLLVLASAIPCAAIPYPLTEYLHITESLTIVIIHAVHSTPPPPAVIDPPAIVWTEGEVISSPLALEADAPLAHTPEPATLLLVGSSLAALGWFSRRRRRSTP